jgi:Ca2+-binding EF-hand superfamily protein
MGEVTEMAEEWRMKVLTAASLVLVAVLSGCGQPLASLSTAPVPMANAQSTRAVKTSAKAILAAAFVALDKNGDGFLDRNEFVMMTGLPFEMTDLSKDGKVTVQEFSSDAAVANYGRSLRYLATGVARALDTDKDKQISETEFLTAFAKADPSTVGLAKAHFASADRRHNGKLGASEFEDLFVTLVQNGALFGMPQPVYPAPKPPAPKPPAPKPPAPKPPAPQPGNGGGTPAPAPGTGGGAAPAGPGAGIEQPTVPNPAA